MPYIGVADIGGILTFEVHDKLAQVLVKELTSSPPPGYQNVTLDQVARADMEVWKLVSACCAAGLQPEVLVDPAA
eukprot:5563039-Amphidinium_carterae.2